MGTISQDCNNIFDVFKKVKIIIGFDVIDVGCGDVSTLAFTYRVNVKEHGESYGHIRD